MFYLYLNSLKRIDFSYVSYIIFTTFEDGNDIIFSYVIFATSEVDIKLFLVFSMKKSLYRWENKLLLSFCEFFKYLSTNLSMVL